MTEKEWLEGLAKLDELIASTQNKSERAAAEDARLRIIRILERYKNPGPIEEYRIAPSDIWMRRVLLAQCKRYELEHFRYRGQNKMTVVIRCPKRIMTETFWPEFLEICDTLKVLLDEATDKTIIDRIGQEPSDVIVVKNKPK